MHIVTRNGFSAVIVTIAAVIVLVLSTLSSPILVAAQSEPKPYITVVIQSGDDTVSWSDPDGCSSDYNIYKGPNRFSSYSETTRTHLGSAASGSTQATLAISDSGSWRNFALELYCGTYDSNSRENELVASTEVPIRPHVRQGTYSSAPLTVLTISSGTLSPDFDRGIKLYTAEVASDVEVITLDPTVLTGYQTDFVRNPTWGMSMACHGYDDCSHSYGDGTTTGIVLSDSNTDAEGFQVNLDRGENQLGLGVNKGTSIPGSLYYLTLTVQNSPATGGPTISGTAQVGGTLTADTSGIADVDGLDNVAYSYQWLTSRDTEIDGATDSTHTLVAAVEGKTIKVRVTFTDDAGYEESLTSEATGVVAPNGLATGAPTITGTVKVGETLTGGTSGIADEDGLGNATFTYQWIHSDGTADLDIDGATSATYTITATDVGQAIKVRVSYTDDAGNVESLTSSATVPVPIEVAFTFKLEGASVTCDSYNVDAANILYMECDDPSSTEQGTSGEIEVEIEIGRSVSSQLYKFNFYIYQMEDSLGHFKTHEANDLCLGSGLADSASREVTPNDGTGPVTYTDEGTIFELCPAGTYELNVPWYRYNYTDQEYQYAGTFRRYFFINSNDEEDMSIERVQFITALYPDPPASHDAVQIEATKESEVLNRELATFFLSIGGLVPDSDPETTDYVVRLRVIGDDGREVPWCHVGNVGYSYLLKTVPEDGGWAMDAHVLGGCISHWWPEILRIELFNGSYEYIAGKDISFSQLPNSPATGAPTISGTPTVGQVLTASASSIVDADGLSNSVFTYQWVTSDGTTDADISGATNATHVIASQDVGNTLKVRVSFTDDAGNEETLTSAAIAAVVAGVPGVPGNLAVSLNDTGRLDVFWDAPHSDGGLPITGYKVQWKESSNSWGTPADVSETTVTGTSSTVTGLTDGVEYTFRLFAVNSAGESAASTEGSGTPRETTAPTVSSASVDGAALTVNFSEGLTESPVPATTTFAVTVGQNGRGVDSIAISGSTVTLTLASAVTASDQVRVSYTVPTDQAATRLMDLNENPAESFSDQGVTNNTTAAQPALTASIHDEPTPHDGQAEFTFELRFSEEFTLSYKTLRDHAFTVTGGEVKGARRLAPPSNTRWGIKILPTSNADVTIVLPITEDCTGQGAVCTQDGRKLSNQLEVVVPGPTPTQNSQAEGSPTIGGTVQVGETLSAGTSGISDANGLSNAAFAYQWLADGTEINGATAATYILADADEGKTIQVRVSFTDDVGNGEELTSAATAAVGPKPNTPAAGAPTITGTAQVGETLTADTSGISDGDGLTNATFAYQWLADDAEINGATSFTYTLLEADEGKTIKVRVAITDDAGNAEELTSVATGAVAAAIISAPLTASAHNAPSTHDGSTAFTFELRFSEEFQLSYVTLRDHAFTVTGGEVTNARRLERPSNIRWEITVVPDSTAAVSVVLPVTTECENPGAICTGDGRKLSNRNELTISGPSG